MNRPGNPGGSGLENKTEPTQSTPSIAVYTPDPTLGLAGTIASVDEVNF